MRQLILVILMLAMCGCGQPEGRDTGLTPGARLVMEARLRKLSFYNAQMRRQFKSYTLSREPERALPNWERGQKIQGLLDSVLNEMEQVKQELLGMAGDGGQMRIAGSGKSNSRTTQDLGKQGRGVLLLKRMDKAIVIVDSLKRYGEGFVVHAGWRRELARGGLPVAATVTAITALQVALAEYELRALMSVYNCEFNTHNANSRRDSVIDIDVVAPSHVVAGQDYNAAIGADTKPSRYGLPFQMFVDSAEIEVHGRLGIYTVHTAVPGTYKWHCLVRANYPDGTVRDFRSEEYTYTVVQPAAIVPVQKTRSMYTGKDNVFTVFAPYVPDDKIHVSISSGTITKVNGKYIVRVEQPGTATVRVSADIGGKEVGLCSVDYKVVAGAK